MTPLLAGLLGSEVAVVETGSTEPDRDALLPQERSLIAKAAPGRVRDFTLGRRCARQAMDRLGVKGVAVLSGPGREPLWPDELVGSITHTAGYVAAAVARRSDRLAVGIDVEPNGPLEDGVVARIARPEELTQLATEGPLSVERLLFCAKEAIYKVWFPIAGCWLGYHDASVQLDLGGGTFDAEILIDGPLRSLSGRFAHDDRFVVAAIELSADHPLRSAVS